MNDRKREIEGRVIRAGQRRKEKEERRRGEKQYKTKERWKRPKIEGSRKREGEENVN